jgi:hypothetical protein
LAKFKIISKHFCTEVRRNSSRKNEGKVLVELSLKILRVVSYHLLRALTSASAAIRDFSFSSSCIVIRDNLGSEYNIDTKSTTNRRLNQDI